MSPLHALPPLLLHAGQQVAITSFSVHVSTVIGLVALAGLYEWRARSWEKALGARRSALGYGISAESRELTAESSALRAPQRTYFYIALATIFLSLNGWLHDLSDYYLFSAHMVQHLVLTLVACPLLIMGTPGWMLRPTLDWPVVGKVARWITRPATCFISFNVVMAGWHLPVLYNTALAHHDVHIVQHLMFMVAAVLMWWPILSPLPELPRLAYPLQMLYLFLMSIPMSVVAIYIALADHVLYPAYSAAPRLWGITPIQDQMIGGLIMWIPGGLFFFGIITVIFFRWQQAGGDDTQISAQVA